MGTGLTATYFDTVQFSGPSVTRVDPQVDFDWQSAAPVAGIKPGTYSARWTGTIEPRFSETYTFHTTGNDGVRLWVNGRQLVDDWRKHAATTNTGTITLHAGERYDIVMEYFQDSGTASAKLEWSSRSQPREVVPASQLYPTGEATGRPAGVLPTASPRIVRALARASDVLQIAPTATGTWFGRTVSGGEKLSMYTYAGDANLDGTINGDDYFLLDSNAGRVGANWYNGDFNFDGKVDGDDYFLIDSNASAARGGARLTPDAGPEAALPGAWKQIFGDEFEGNTLNPVWHTAQYWNHEHTVVGHGELQAYDASGASVSGGMLHLTARREAAHGMEYVSGLVQTGGDITVGQEPKFSFLHGYMEVRAKLPAGQGLWPAIWMMPASHNDDNGELDVLEVTGDDPSRANFNLHRNGLNDGHEWVGPDFSQDFHTFGVDWQADHVAWYVDGVERARTTDPRYISPEAMYPILNVALGGDWAGAPDATTPFPATMDVDYVRVWQQQS
ncbi:MAG TPA: PA14 domain-containing protein [Tepidisphaeraceae bacterium]|nr:PA14 domain-containing protein [Tepidisphaeraceae bacterium]